MAITIDVLLARMGLDASQLDSELPKQTQKFQTFFGAVSQSAGVLMNGIKNLAAVASAGLTAISVGMKKAIHDAGESEAVWSRLAGGIERVGLHSRITMDFVEGLAVRMQKLTTQGDETTASMANMLLKYRSIQGEMTYERIIKAAKDFAAATGGDAVGSIHMLGRALENPVLGMRMLALQAGLAQKEIDRVKKLAESGNQRGAQQALLAAFEQRFKGAAETEAGTFKGMREQLSNIVGDVWEEIGFVVLPRAKELVKWLTEIGWKTKDWIAANRDILQQRLDAVLEKVVPLVGKLLDSFKAVFSGSGNWKDWLVVVGSFTSLGYGLEKVGGYIPIFGTFITMLGRAISPLSMIRGAIAFIAPWVKLLVPLIAAIPAPVLAIGAAVAALVAGLTLFFTKTEAGQKAWKAMVDFMAASWKWLVEQITAAFAWLFNLYKENEKRIDRILDGMKEIAGFLVGQLGKAFRELWGVIKQFGADFGKFIVDAGTELASLAEYMPDFGVIFKIAEKAFADFLKVIEAGIEALKGDTRQFQVWALEAAAVMLDLIKDKVIDSMGPLFNELFPEAGKKFKEGAETLRALAGGIQGELDADRAAKDERIAKEKEAAAKAQEMKEKQIAAGVEPNEFGFMGADPEALANQQAALEARKAENERIREGREGLFSRRVDPRFKRGRADPQNPRMLGGRGAPLGFDPRGEFVPIDAMESDAGELRDAMLMRQNLMRQQMRDARGEANAQQFAQLAELQGGVRGAMQGVVGARRGLDIAERMKGPGREEAIAQAQEALFDAINLADQANEAFVGAIDNIKSGSEELHEAIVGGAGDLEEGAMELGDGMAEAGEKIKKAGEQVDEFGNKLEEAGEEAAKTPEQRAAEAKARKKADDEARRAAGIMTPTAAQAQFDQALAGITTGAAAGIGQATLAGAKLAAALQGADRKTQLEVLSAKVHAERQQAETNLKIIEGAKGFGGQAQANTESIMKLTAAITNLTKLEENFREEYGTIAGNARPMALGGIVVRKTFAMLGENGPEAVIPLDRRAGLTAESPITMYNTFTKKYSKEDAEELLDHIDRAIQRRGVDMSGRSGLRRPARRTPINSRIR